MTALEPLRESQPPGDRLDHAVVVALGLAACALTAAGFTSQRLGVPAALWVAAGGAVPLSLGLVLLLHERSHRFRDGERVRRRETAAILAEKLEQARQRAVAQSEAEPAATGMPPSTSVKLPVEATDTFPDPAVDFVAETSVELERSLKRVAQLEETVIDLNRQVGELQKVIQGASHGARSAARAGRHSGVPEQGSSESGPSERGRSDRGSSDREPAGAGPGLDGMVEETA
jgi:hypothetical protein